MYEAESALRQATLQWKTAQSQYEVLMLRPRPQAIAEAKTRIDVAQAAVDTAKAQVEQLTIRCTDCRRLEQPHLPAWPDLVGRNRGGRGRRFPAAECRRVAERGRRPARERPEQDGPNLRLRCGRPDPLRDRRAK